MKTDLLKNCKLGSHTFNQIDYSPDIGSSVKWCRICGSVVIDKIIDNRTAPGYYMKLKSPEITKLNVKNDEI